MTNRTAFFEIYYSQFLNEHVEVVQELPSFAKDPQKLINLYRMMNLCRLFDNKAVTLQRTGKIGTYAGIQGQEAVSVAIGSAMLKEDVLCPAYREYGAYLQRGVTMQDIFAYWGGDERGSNFADSEDFPICVPIATQCLHAAGVAVAFKLRQQKRVAVTVLGDGGTSEGDFYEAINLAGDWHLPIVFVVNNNQWAISVPRSAQTGAKTIAQKAIAAGFDGNQVDGNDIIAMHHAVDQALAKARDGGGPSLIEAITYRLCDHTTADDAKRYRSQEEFDTAKQKEPISRLRKYLMQLKAWDETKEQQLLEQCSAEVEKAVETYMNMTLQPATAMFDYLYAELPEAYKSQYEQLINE